MNIELKNMKKNQYIYLDKKQELEKLKKELEQQKKLNEKYKLNLKDLKDKNSKFLIQLIVLYLIFLKNIAVIKVLSIIMKTAYQTSKCVRKKMKIYFFPRKIL